jgi:hypothetical protein
MAKRTSTHTAFGSEFELLAGIWALVCVAVLITAALA